MCDKMFRVLYVNKQKQSEEAEKLLRANNITYNRIQVNGDLDGGYKPPHLLAPEGCFPDLESIDWYVNNMPRDTANR